MIQNKYHLLYMDTPKYVMAVIEIPIEVNEKNECKSFMHLLNMTIRPLDRLPKAITDPVVQQKLKDNLFIFLSQTFPDYKIDDEEDVLDICEIIEEIPIESDVIEIQEIQDTKQVYIGKEEMKQSKRPVNNTFKTYHKPSCKKYTVKNYDNNGR